MIRGLERITITARFGADLTAICDFATLQKHLVRLSQRPVPLRVYAFGDGILRDLSRIDPADWQIDFSRLKNQLAGYLINGRHDLLHRNIFTTHILKARRPCPERMIASRTFYEAYRDKVVRDFSRDCMAKGYAEGIMAYHPGSSHLDQVEVHKDCQWLWRQFFLNFELFLDQPDQLWEYMHRTGRNKFRIFVPWYRLLDPAFLAYSQAKIRFTHQSIAPFLSGTSLADVGCGSAIKTEHIRKHQPNLTRIIGIDVAEFCSPRIDIEYHIHDFSYSAYPESFDNVILQYVLHHVSENENKVSGFLNNLRKSVKKRLFVFEDIMISPACLRLPISGLAELDSLRKTRPLLDRFIELPVHSQKAALMMADILINAFNLGAGGMSFNYGFRSISDWLSIFQENGFTLRHFKYLGFQAGHFSQNSKGLFVFDAP